MSESINPNQSVSEPMTNEKGAVEVNGPDMSGDLWDALDTPKKAKKAEKSEESAEKKPEKSKDLTSDDKKGEPKAEKKAEPKEKAEKDEPKEEKAPETEAEIKKAIKKLKAKAAEGDIEIDEDALFDIKINGKVESVPLREVINNYSGKTNWDRKYSELNTEKTKFTKAQEYANNKLKDIFEEQDAEMKLFKLAELAGQDPVKFYQGWHESSIKLLENYYQMDDSSRRAAMLEAENKYHRTKAEKLEAERNQEIERSQYEAKTSQLKAQAKVSDDEFEASYQALQEMAKDPALKQALKLSDDITPETVIEAITKDRILRAASSKLAELKLDWTEAEKSQKLLQFTENALELQKILRAKDEENRSLNILDDVPDMIDQIFGVKAVKKKVESKEKEREEFLKGKQEVVSPKAKKEEVLLFDDL
jgi:hypothetical protein